MNFEGKEYRPVAFVLNEEQAKMVYEALLIWRNNNEEKGKEESRECRNTLNLIYNMFYNPENK